MPETPSTKVTRQESLDYHALPIPGKISVVSTKPCSTQRDLSMAYTPGVAHPCLEIEKDPELAYKYTAKGNLVAVITNSTAVLGLGDIGDVAGKPVMEGKGVLFKQFGDVDVFDIEVTHKDPIKFCEAVEAISPTFGGINLEDIKAPECFYIEDRLKESLNIPVMHDDQHGTAIVSGAALLNAVEIANKKINEIIVVVSGAGAAAIACSKFMIELGVEKQNILMCDSKGVITTKRDNLNPEKEFFAVDTDKVSLDDAINGADVFLGVSKAGLLKKEMVAKMAPTPIIFAMANPTPEILPEEVAEVREDAIMATGRSDYPNQINNVLGFPFIFRGALDVRATRISEGMKIAAAKALAGLAKLEMEDDVVAAYGKKVSFSKEYILPKPFDRRLISEVAGAVANAAVAEGLAKVTDFDLQEYKTSLLARIANR
jgi:malate dehydrogenase (oxaloacetate-decarboxylating)(NADP+)